ncbi:ExbD/TolR family protein [Methanothermobacter thermautotrophicus]|uniref:ExbD/TolR family protein n=1 Tax=Methanothermobacter thermautotrophicus TaxID=145262 RepID=UPI0022B95F13|nr:biopolymer transporter ExbD [Methanothermobacter thermautotrophicus]WBF07376.1 biopolymer transporter ExbD [Methanothermobacter thermautotrophicus]
MALDTERYRNKIHGKPRFNMVPFIDILFTILIFLVVTATFSGGGSGEASGKPEISENTGPSEYYLIPVAGLRRVTVNGIDMSDRIRNGAVAVHTRVIDEGEIIIRPKEGAIIITTPPDLPVERAVRTPS